MKIKTIEKDYAEVAALPRSARKKPRRPSRLLHTVVRLGAIPSLVGTHCRITGREVLKGAPPSLLLMNHSCFLDLKIAFKLLYPRPFSVVCTTDAMIGKASLMRGLGCIPTQKFVSDMTLIRDMKYALEKNRTHVLLFPEAGYSFDGTATALPHNLGGLCKLLDVPVVTVITRGAFLRDPLYNGLRLRRVRVSAEVTRLLTLEEVRTLSAEAITERLQAAFTFDNFAWQADNRVKIDAPFRAEGLHRILYKCPACGAEGRMEGRGTELSCHACGKTYHLDEYGRLAATEGVTEYPHIPDWYAWQREEVRSELRRGDYRLDTPVDIAMLVDDRALYRVGSGWLTHGAEGFHLLGCEGRLDYRQKPLACHTLNADFFWYEMGDVIGIGDRRALYYCFPPAGVPVAKVRLAAEELYRAARG